ncbi:MAG: hypothetical protein GXP49_11645 [Deltaproteobacteria bacterium]|nr:hypothetical protein [Deltaproteobacteria bacterium]
MTRGKVNFLSTSAFIGAILLFGLSCSEYFFSAYPDIEVKACPEGTCPPPSSVVPSTPPGKNNPTNANFTDPGLSTNADKPERVTKLTLRLYNVGEGPLEITAPSKDDISLGMDSCIFGLETPQDYQGSPCPPASNKCECLDDQHESGGNCAGDRPTGVKSYIVLQSGGYADYILTYAYTKLHSGCSRTLTIQNQDPDRADLVGEKNSENPWVVNLIGSPSCNIEFKPADHDFGNSVTGRTLGQKFEMRLSDNCPQVRLVGMRIVDDASANPQAQKRGGLGSLCMAPDADGKPVAEDSACANKCFMGAANVARCTKDCAKDEDCGNGMTCQQQLCWPGPPYDKVGAGGGSDMAVIDFTTREAPDAPAALPKYLKSHADADPDGWLTATMTCTQQQEANRKARVEVMYDLGDNNTRSAYLPLSGSCGQCPVAVVDVTDPKIDEVEPLDTVLLDGTGSHSPSGKTITYRWYFKKAPMDSHTGFNPECNPGAVTAMDSCSNAAQPSFFVDLVGTYEPCLEICEQGGACTSDPECKNDKCVTINANPKKAIITQLVWDHPKTDVDLHYIRSGAKYGDTTATNPGGDCHYFNPHPDYCKAGDKSDDPSLDIDDVEGYGPENIGHTHPCDDTYRIWVTYYEDYSLGSTMAKVRVFIKGVQQNEQTHILEKRNCHWLVGTVKWSNTAYLHLPTRMTRKPISAANQTRKIDHFKFFCPAFQLIFIVYYFSILFCHLL